MDYNVSQWLKNDLRLLYMSESDINCLMFHPRHGGLCRRLVKLLVESTLCNQRYPDVHVKEEYEVATAELAEKSKLADQLLDQIDRLSRTIDDQEQTFKSQLDQLDYLSRLEDLHKTSAEALEEMASRPNFGLEQMSRNIADPSYLGNLDLEQIYDIQLEIDRNCLRDSISPRKLALVEEELHELVNKTNVLHRVTGKVLQSVQKSMRDIDTDLALRRTNAEKLAALRLPECEIVEEQLDQEEKDLKEQNELLNARVEELHGDVLRLANDFKARKSNLARKFKADLEPDVTLLKQLQEFEICVNASKCDK